MSTFDEELQIILDRHPEIEEVRVKYKKAGTVFKPKINTVQSIAHLTVGLQSSESSMVAEMIKAGELT